MTTENFFPELKHFRIKTTDKCAQRKLVDILAAKSITTEDLDVIFECVEPKPDGKRNMLITEAWK